MIPPLQNETRSTPWWNPIAQRPSILWVFIIGLLILRLAWQYISPYTLIEDEAHYWEWSRHLDWSYYSKGPGVAWVIRASTTLLGTSEFAIRVPAAIATAAGTYAVAQMTRDHFTDRRLPLLSAILYSCVPGFGVAAMMMTIDAPYIASWALASFFALRAILKGSKSSWLHFGLWIAIGFLFKYTILLLLPGVLLAMLLTKNQRPKSNKINPRFLVGGLLIALVGLVPVLVWNDHHDWATVRHLLGHLRMHGGDTEPTSAYRSEPWTILWMLEYVGLQILVGGPVLFLAIFAWINSKKHADPRTHRIISALVAMAAPILIFYFLVSLKTETEGNWAMGAFVTLIPAAAWGALDGVERIDHPVKFTWGAAIFMGISILLLFPGARWLSTRPGIGHYIPLYRMSGLREHAKDAQRVIDELRASTGLEPLIMSEHYGRASLLAFYLPGRPTVYCTSAQVGGRKTQYDMWTWTDLTNPDTLAPLLGRPGILFGGRPDEWTPAFDHLKDIGPLIAEPKHHKTTYIGTNFHTFDSWTPPKPIDEDQKTPESP